MKFLVLLAATALAVSPAAGAQDASQPQAGLVEIKVQTLDAAPKALRFNPSFDHAVDSTSPRPIREKDTTCMRSG